MADYNKQTVAQLRQLLKDRGIPSTGLTRKAQIVEKLEEEDGNVGDGAPSEKDAQAEVDALPSPEEDAQGLSREEEDVPGPALSEAGGWSTRKETDAQKANEETEPAAQPIGESEPPSIPTATLDGNRETVSHIDSDVPPPDRLKAIEQSAEDTTMDAEPGTVQPAGVFSAPPADPEDVIGPKVTEPSDNEVDGNQAEDLAPDELPTAPGPAAEALRIKRQEQELSKEELDTAMEDRISTPVTIEEPSVEKADLPTIPERSTADTSRLNTEEWEADTKKRKRRSGSPDLPLQDIKAKKPRPSQEPAPEVYLKQDDDVVMEQRQPEESNGTPTAKVEQTDAGSPTVEADNKPSRKEKTDRYKNLVKPNVDDASLDALQDDRPVEPALHPATPALYIRNFMRPLRPEPLRAHLVSLASPPSGSPDASIVKSLFLDAMKTHALVLFSNITAASRVRASLHGSIWPPEGNRKELWVDFIPEDNVEDWITQEEDAITAEKEARAAGRPIPAKRFEIVYPDNATAVFQEVGSRPNVSGDTSRGARGSISMVDIRRPSQPTVLTQDTRQDIEASFKTLDQLFSSTTAKPNLYFLPVSDEISDARLKELDNETSRDWAPVETRKGRGLKAEMKYKYSFDDEDRIVEVGEDRGPWAEDYRPRGGRGGFRARGGGRGRGGGGWRG
jgi:hypothetical protein